jgi:hypothetical protein
MGSRLTTPSTFWDSGEGEFFPVTYRGPNCRVFKGLAGMLRNGLFMPGKFSPRLSGSPIANVGVNN